MKFSQRNGYSPILDQLQRESMNDALRNQLWSAVFRRFFEGDSPLSKLTYDSYVTLRKFDIFLYQNYFKLSIDKVPTTYEGIVDELRGYFFTCNWFEVYDFLEVVLSFKKSGKNNDQFEKQLNTFLESELSTYRFIDGVCTDITTENEIDEVKEALEVGPFEGAQNHLKRALELLYDREKPDFRNSIKESISAVESAARSITGKPKANLSNLIPLLESQHNLHPVLKEALTKLYGYTSDEGGIRHAMMESPNLTAADARFFVISCSAFINYLKANLQDSK